MMMLSRSAATVASKIAPISDVRFIAMSCHSMSMTTSICISTVVLIGVIAMAAVVPASYPPIFGLIAMSTKAANTSLVLAMVLHNILRNQHMTAIAPYHYTSWRW